MPPDIKPVMNANDRASPVSALWNVPLMPVTLPMRRAFQKADRPIARPPATASNGVKVIEVEKPCYDWSRLRVNVHYR